MPNLPALPRLGQVAGELIFSRSESHMRSMAFANFSLIFPHIPVGFGKLIKYQVQWGVSKTGEGDSMRSQLRTYHLRKFINQIVDSTLMTPSLAEMVRHHLRVNWTREHQAPFLAFYQVFDEQESYLELYVLDSRGYPEPLYERGLALLKIGVNGALASPDDDSYATQAFAGRPFRVCPYCQTPFARWLDFYGHIKTAHWERQAIS